MKTPISYYGGKQRIASKIINLFPPHKVYAEPFCGGAAVLFAKGYPEVSNNNHYREAINDKNGEVVNFFRVLRDPDKSVELIRLLEWTPYARDEHKQAAEIYNHPEQYSDIERAWALFIQTNCSFANGISKGWAFGIKSENNPETFINKKKRLHDQAQRLQKVYVENSDALAFIKRWDSPDTLFYVDPHYPTTNCGHYSGYTLADFYQLLEGLKDIKGRFVLSNYMQDNMSDDWHLVTIDATCSAAKNVRTKRVECVWTNFVPEGYEQLKVLP